MSSPPIPVSSNEGVFDPSVRWFQHAVFYELLIRGFYDANDDGTGDLVGLREKLDYMEWLGIDCIWMLPFYPSPFRDGGYDISDFFNVHPDYGSISDLVAFPGGRPPPQHPRRRRPRDEPHERRASVVH